MNERLPSIEPKRLYQQIAAVLRRSIDDGKFAIGTLLPPERELAEQLGVSRTSVREALIALEVEGRVSVRVGVGVQVLDARTAAAPDASGGAEPPIGPLDLLEARLVVEPETAALAARNAHGSDLATLRGALERMIEESRQGSTRHVADRAFHLEIARLAGNAALSLIVAQLWDHRRTLMQERLETLFSTPERFTAAQRDHEAILAAIAAADPDAARSAMRRHIARVRDALSRAIEGG
jgi:DNA-binding FadR family transcriptional regulator